MMRGLIMDGHNSLYLTTLSLLYRLVNILYIRTLFFLLNTFRHEWPGLVTLCNELHYITCFDLYTVSKPFLMKPNTISQIITFSHLD
jgi:predicted tellurium resistance membrane protein TerC